MIYITGDMHGDPLRFKDRALRRLRKNDVLIICGDFGFVWDKSQKEQRLLRQIGRRRYHVLFVEGVHDNHKLLEEYPEARWNGGRVRDLGGRLRMLMRGEVYTIDGKTVFAFGGGPPDDANPAGALPSLGELENARGNLKKTGYAVDYIITHQPSRKISQALYPEQTQATTLESFLDEVRERCSYRRWFFGSIHRNKIIPPRDIGLFTQVMAADAPLV